ncbi:hypothetical protein [Lactobacillus xujianguonis]|uniref:hypothetical protein n=1 Tax=Lactobacillus xujianguonis TaxID=2495899 RepID=UPI000FD6F0D9|nr:hypothetical protein [Lactobacillus xujianguonis]RVU72294.1 hypothetical protein EJK20_10755 [Lactobacillus xujianguonis]
MLSSNEKPSTKFWKLAKQIKKDQKYNPGVRMSIRKDEVPIDLANLIKKGIITKDDLTDFSPELLQDLENVL